MSDNRSSSRLSGALPIGAIRWCAFLFLLLFWGLASQSRAAEIAEFVGIYKGSVDVTYADGSSSPRDLSVEITRTRKGFSVLWSATTEKNDGRRKEKSYNIEFQPSHRDGLYAAAMVRDLFGHRVQMDPMKGEPYVWSRIVGDTLTIFSVFIHPNGDFEAQQYDRTLAEGGLNLVYTARRNGELKRRIETFLKRD